MKIYTSYFYQVRFFPTNLIPLSTAVWPPKYFGTPLTQHKDKRGVICGLDIPPLKPGPQLTGLCDGKCKFKNPKSCLFLQKYYEQLTTLQFSDIIKSLQRMKEKIELGENLKDINFALMVYEAPNNPCSERAPIQRWFKEHNVNVEEWSLA